MKAGKQASIKPACETESSFWLVIKYLILLGGIFLILDLIFYGINTWESTSIDSSLRLVLQLLISWGIILTLLLSRGLLSAGLFRLEPDILRTGLISYLMGISLSLIILGSMTWLPFSPPESMENYSETARQGSYVLLLVAMLITSPVAEELFFRGFVFGIWNHSYGYYKGLSGSAFLFAISHIFYWKIIVALFAGFLLGYVFSRYKNILVAIACHMGINSAPVLSEPLIRIFGIDPDKIDHIPVSLITLSAVIFLISLFFQHRTLKLTSRDV